jgi:ribosomal protein S18 acetylase RimI-like enzyme
VLRLCEAEDWPSFPADPDRAHRVLTAPGVTAVVALEGGEVIGFAYLQSDGEIQAHLSLLAVAPSHRRLGVGRTLLDLAMREAGGTRLDLITNTAVEFYEQLAGDGRWRGFRLYPPFIGEAPQRARE